MNQFLTAVLKAALPIFAFFGVIALGLSALLLCCPHVLLQILRWGSIGAFAMGGVFLLACALCCCITTNLFLRYKSRKAKTP